MQRNHRKGYPRLCGLQGCHMAASWLDVLTWRRNWWLMSQACVFSLAMKSGPGWPRYMYLYWSHLQVGSWIPSSVLMSPWKFVFAVLSSMTPPSTSAKKNTNKRKHWDYHMQFGLTLPQESLVAKNVPHSASSPLYTEPSNPFFVKLECSLLKWKQVCISVHPRCPFLSCFF